MSAAPRKILVIRNDKLGDFMLAWPALAVLKQTYPDCEICVLIPEYTAPIARLCTWIDDIIIDDRHDSALADARHLAAHFRRHQFDASITLFSRFRTGLALWLARVPQRVAPATKLYQFLHNRRLVQRRSRSEKPEYAYNVDLVNHYIALNGDTPAALPPAPYLHFDHHDIDHIKSGFLRHHGIAPTSRLAFIHPGSGGSANNLSLQQYATLARTLCQGNFFHIVITAGPDELDKAQQLAALLGAVPHTLYHSTHGLAEFARHIAFCDVFISGSTGPLHIAGALNVRTVAFYPTRRSATALRWQTTNDEDRRLAFSPQKIEQDSTLESIDAAACANNILQTFFP